MALFGKLWPIHLKPQEDELLSSWLVRLAHANGYKVMTMCTVLFGYRRPIWNRDIDKLAPADVITDLAEATGTSVERVKETTLKNFECTVFKKLNISGGSRWVLPLGIFHRKRKRFGLQYCPVCLSEDNKPYFRRKWRLGFITVCTKHKILLKDRCDHCGVPVIPHRVDMISKSVFPKDLDNIKCFSCGKLLTDPKGLEIVDKNVVQYQHKWEKSIDDGWIEWAGNHSMYSFLFFDGLRSLCGGLIRKTERHRTSMLSNELSDVIVNKKFMELEYASVNERYVLIKVVLKLISDWPNSFIDIVNKYKLRSCILTNEQEDIPYWYQSVLRHLLNKNDAIPKNEIQSIIEYVERKHGYYSNGLAYMESGHDLSKLAKWYVKPSIPYFDYENMMTSIDHEIGGTLDKNVRYKLLGDKVMLALRRVLGLSVEEIAEFKMSDIESISPVTVKYSFYSVPVNREQVRAWCEWYVDKVRSDFYSIKNNDLMFIIK